MVAQHSSSYDFALELSEGGGFELPDEGSYRIKFLGVKDKKDFPKTDKAGNTIYDEETGEAVMETSLTLQFVIDDEESDFDGTEFRDYFPLRVTTGNKSGRLWAALLGVSVDNLPVPLPRITEFIDKRCVAMLKHRKAGNGNVYPKIESVAPIPRKKPKAAPVVAEVDNEDGGF